MRIIPYVQSDNRIGARRMKKEEEDIFIADLKKKSINVEDTEFVQNEWNQFSKTFKNDYFSIFRGHNRVFRFINRFLGFSDWFYSKQKLTVLQNIIRCESHREAILTMLENKIWQDML
jgi:poly-gamma-glutamate synthesis protein (capsule biosynthesis protein)